MCHVEDYNTNRKKNKHLSEAERNVIEVMWNTKTEKNKKFFSKSDIAKAINVNRSTITREINNRSQEVLNRTKTDYKIIYKAEDAQRDYKYNRAKSFNTPILFKNPNLKKYIEDKIKLEKWSPDAIAGYLKKHPQKFAFDSKISTSTIYKAIHKRRIEVTKFDTRRMISMKDRNKDKIHEQRESKKDRTIHLRPENINNRNEFGHWEMDCVVGKAEGINEVLLTLTERKSRYEIIIKIPRKNSISVVETINIIKEKFKDNFSKIFKTITVDNGVEFSDWISLEKDCKTFIYFADPYSSYQRGTNENHNGIIRWFIPKGTPLENYTHKDIKSISNWMNNYPRKIFNYSTPLELIKEELIKILPNNHILNFFAL